MQLEKNKTYCNDALIGIKKLDKESIDCVVTSPPYWGLRDYGVKGQIGLEKNFNDYIKKLLDNFDEIYRVLKKQGTIWVNLSDTYWGSLQGYGAKKTSETGIQKAPVEAGYYASSSNKPPQAQKHKYLQSKSMVMIPERFALGMVERGWILRNVIIWKKPNTTPESVKDRFTNDFEYLFFFTKSKQYYFEQQYEDFKSNDYDIQRMKDGRKEYEGKYKNASIKKQLKINTQTHSFVAGNTAGRNKRTVWEINTKPFKEAHFAVFPEALIETPIKAGCPKNGIIMDPFMGSGTTGVVAKRTGRNFIGFDLNPEYVKMANERISHSEKLNGITKISQKDLSLLALKVEKELFKI